MSVKIYGNLVTCCGDCPFSYETSDQIDFRCGADNSIKDIAEPFFDDKVHKDCPMLKEETHSITIMLSDQYNKSNG